MNLFWKRIPNTAKFEQQMTDRHELYLSYVKIKESDILKEYRDLAEIDFGQAQKQFKSEEEYEASPLFEKERKLKEIKEDSDLKNYLLYEKSDIFDFHKTYEQTHQEEFTGNSLDTNQWTSAYRWSNDQIKGNYSNEGEFQAYTEGENTKVMDGLLHILTKRKSAEGRVWTAKKGFVTQHFDYTSDLISGQDEMNESGCVMIKIKLDGARKPIQHFVRAYDSTNQRCISVLESLTPRKFIVGRSSREGGKNVSLHNKIRGLNLQKDFHILEVEWNSEVVLWRINGVLIHQDARVYDPKNLHLVIGSRITGKKGGEGRILVDYIRYFSKKETIE